MVAFFAQWGGLSLALLGAAIAVVLGGIGSSLGVSRAGQAGAGITTENPEKFGKVLILEALPGTQGIYGFLVAFLILLFTGILGGAIKEISIAEGWQLFFACLPCGVSCLVSGIMQGNVCVSGMHMIAKDDSLGGKAMILAAMVETYAILGFLISALAIFFIKL